VEDVVQENLTVVKKRFGYPDSKADADEQVEAVGNDDLVHDWLF
jgi:hypothetical protein